MSLDAPLKIGKGAGRVGAMSLRRYLLAGILLPVAVFLMVNTVLLYRSALDAADTAYDRTLLASAKTLAELLEATGTGDAVRLKATVAYSALGGDTGIYGAAALAFTVFGDYRSAVSPV